MTVAQEVAKEMVEKWLNRKKVYPNVRVKYEDSIEVLTDAIQAGDLVYDEEKHLFEHTLLFPLGEDGKGVTQVTYKGRLNDIELSKYMKGVDATDGDERITAIIAALTMQARGIIKGFDTADKKIARSIAAFFI